MALVDKVLTIEEVAEILRIDVGEVRRLVDSGEVDAFGVLGEPRIREGALNEFMARPFVHPAQDGGGTAPRRQRALRDGNAKRRRDSEAARRIRDAVERSVKETSGTMRWTSRRRFEANGKTGVLTLATMRTGPKDDYWLGFDGSVLKSNSLVFVVIGLPEALFVVPFERHKDTLENLSENATGYKQFHVDDEHGEYELIAKVGVPNIRLGRYRDAFDVFR